jgi:hypothetical protein
MAEKHFDQIESAWSGSTDHFSQPALITRNSGLDPAIETGLMLDV